MTVLTGCSGNTSTTRLSGAKPALENGAPFGAIAFSNSTRRWQIESDLPTRLAARTKALSGCRANDCRVLAEFRRGQCASLSLDAANATTAPYVSVATDAGSAISSARQSCNSAGGKDCKASPPICN
ncbi:DUF4189 domain-containing protein [Anderseniella sp. Alg231-50]|uniref:DUF4189 domain-containing protein n=1 Tax=Anderseniella sp. Alg231-50 TaxID=1922226 RepID=UPI003FCCE8AE